MITSHPLTENLWTTKQGHLHFKRLRREAMELSSRRPLPASAGQWQERACNLRRALEERLLLPKDSPSLDIQIHGETAFEGYRLQTLSYCSAPGIRVTANLFIPDGQGPFPAVLNLHGHTTGGKIAPAVQARGHLLALNGMVVLSVDAAGSGERADAEREWGYHGTTKGGELFLGGDSLLGLQVRDNRRAVDVLASLPFVDAGRIGATGASGGGNQTMWVAALDERIRAVVPVVSVGSFEAYVGRRNCICETLPGGLELAEEWEVLGLIAPRRLLILNALHDQPAFGYEPMSETCGQLQEIYAMLQSRHHFDWRILNMTHGYHPEAAEAMLGWMRRWLCGEPGSSPVALPHWVDAPEEEVLCYRKGERPDAVGFGAVRKALLIQLPTDPAAKSRERLAQLVGWKAPASADWVRSRSLARGGEIGVLQTSRGLPIPVGFSLAPGKLSGEVRLILSPRGRKDPFVAAQLASAEQAQQAAITADLPATGELLWDKEEVAGSALHDASRACLWLGYTLAGEWAEAIAGICLFVQKAAPAATIRIVAHQEAAFASLLAVALARLEGVRITEVDSPQSMTDPKTDTLVWMVPRFLQWGDLDALRELAGA